MNKTTQEKPIMESDDENAFIDEDELDYKGPLLEQSQNSSWSLMDFFKRCLIKLKLQIKTNELRNNFTKL